MPIVFSAETVERYVAESLAALTGARIEDFVPLFVHRFARERLRALGQLQGTIDKAVPEVLFVCVQNAGRSQMAAGPLDHHAEGRVHVRSAGSEPADRINPNVVAVMAELGVDISKEFPKPLTDEVVVAADAVVHDGMWRRPPDLSRQALRGLGGRRSRGGRPRGGAPNPRRHCGTVHRLLADIAAPVG
jgi:arsenate reductase